MKPVKIRVYQYDGCSTCRKALKFLDNQGIEHERVPIVEAPPSLAELTTALASTKERGGGLKALFNVSGALYREMKVADRLADGMGEKDALELLAKHGKLIKRPLLSIDGQGALVGFNEAEWRARLGL